MKPNFEQWIVPHQVYLHKLFPTVVFDAIATPDMSIGSSFFGKPTKKISLKKATKYISNFQKSNPTSILVNGYLEERSFYDTKSYERNTPNGKELRNIHLGTDFWIPEHTPIHAIFDSKVIIAFDNTDYKDYGPTLVLQHNIEGNTFYTLYGHLSKNSLELATIGENVKKGDCIGFIGGAHENGSWVPHLHFQVITDLLGNLENYDGVAYPSEIEMWKKRCPNPNVLFKEHLPSAEEY